MKFLWPILLFGLFFGLYLVTLSPTVSPQGDAGELITTAYTLGINHPPGYPLYTIVAHLFTHLPFETVAWRVNLFSALAQSLTLVFVYLIIYSLTKNKVAAFGAAAALGLSQIFWLYSLVTEVFSLNDLFAAILIYLALQEKPRLYLLILIASLALFHHQTIVLLFPALFYFLHPHLKSTPRLQLAGVSAVSLIIGALPYFYSFLRAQTALMPVAWNYPDNLLAIVRLLTRADYGPFNSVINADPALATLAEKIGQVGKLLSYSLEDFTTIGLLLSLLGLLIAFFKNSRLAIFLFLGFFFTGPFFLSYANFPLTDPSGFALAAIERFYLLPYLFIALSFGLALHYLSALFGRINALRFLFAPLVIFYLVILLMTNFSLVNQRGNYWDFSLGKNILQNLPPHSLILVQGDLPTFSAFYVRYVEHFRPDIEIITANNSGPLNRYRYLKKVRPDLDFSSPEIANIPGFLRANLSRAPIYSFGPLGVDYPGLLATPSGLLFHYSGPDSLTASYSLPSQEEIKWHYTLADSTILWYYMRSFSYLGDSCVEKSNYSCAISNYRQALLFGPSYLKLNYALAKAYEENNNCSAAEAGYLRVLDLNSQMTPVYSDLVRLADSCFKDPAKAKFYQDKLRANPASGDALKNL